MAIKKKRKEREVQSPTPPEIKEETGFENRAPIIVMGLFGSSNHSPFMWKAALSSMQIKSSVIMSRYPGSIPKEDILIFSSRSSFFSHWRYMPKGKTAIVCDAPAPLMEIENLIPLDFTQLGEDTWRFSLQCLSMTNAKALIQERLDTIQPTEVTYKSVKLVPKLLQEALPSVLIPLQSYLYSIGDTDERLEKARLFYHWLAADDSPQALKETLQSSRPKKSLDRLIEFLESVPGIAMKEAVHERHYQKTAVSVLQKRYSIEKFDLLYLVKKMKTQLTYGPLN